MRRIVPALGLLLAACAPHGAPAPADDRVQWGSVALPESVCVGDGDGVLDEDEVVIRPELTPLGAFLVDPSGQTVSGLDSRWELDFDPSPQDEAVFLGPDSMAGAWFEGWFPAGEFSALTDFGGAGRSIYSASTGSLMLLGVASDEAGTSVLRYDPAVPVMPVPMQVGDAWTVEAEASGEHEGQEYPADFGLSGIASIRHRYDFEVTGSSVVSLPAGDLPALLLRLHLTTEAVNSLVGVFATETVRVDLLVAECLGVVARVRSQPDEPSADFTVAAEVMRLGIVPELLP